MPSSSPRISRRPAERADLDALGQADDGHVGASERRRSARASCRRYDGRDRRRPSRSAPATASRGVGGELDRLGDRHAGQQRTFSRVRSNRRARFGGRSRGGRGGRGFCASSRATAVPQAPLPGRRTSSASAVLAVRGDRPIIRSRPTWPAAACRVGGIRCGSVARGGRCRTTGDDGPVTSGRRPRCEHVAPDHGGSRMARRQLRVYPHPNARRDPQPNHDVRVRLARPAAARRRGPAA